ncbi:uncharacterized protein MONOS_13057 [Monocercomonoides exilis]|uniref:uncharacterized protein n=1 Tax=Monocercomonoides exilis TaxID=2049356 RepID=UPI003559CA57|nr:hypothetical protein MONOS_13057 [Monocercomonoides exilis]|eukprot:MONOS_13057.1-p1 / transcript=MONOS_13057.1 / gene=MONOS_13057 / organism=Monocercomonoides_exilis_PA203 / gene_product=unspecified product / transcript_product=unspecified product / location=Mono_scaffold00772:20219-21118(+) / protein_length=300 / sequence_SO=supercontig / SO=protein_coding / is_pseudo=false
MGRMVALCEAGEIVEKGMLAAGLRMEDVVLFPEAIALAMLDGREEVEEGNGNGEEGEEKGEEDGGKDGGREGGDGNEEKGWYPTAHRKFVERIKEKQGKLEEAMAPLAVEALGLSRLRFVKAEAEAGADKQHSEEPELCSSSPSDGIQEEISRAEEEAADGSLEITSDGCSDEVRKDVEQVQISTDGLEMNEELEEERGIMKFVEEEEEEEIERMLKIRNQLYASFISITAENNSCSKDSDRNELFTMRPHFCSYNDLVQIGLCLLFSAICIFSHPFFETEKEERKRMKLIPMLLMSVW